MSMRTVIEIDHAYLSAMLADYDPFERRKNDRPPIPMLELLWALRQGTKPNPPQGVRVLSEPAPVTA
jgi:hypothetical protein